MRDFRRATGGPLPLVAVGGIDNGADAMARIRAGASLVQLYSAMSTTAPALPGWSATSWKPFLGATAPRSPRPWERKALLMLNPPPRLPRCCSAPAPPSRAPARAAPIAAGVAGAVSAADPRAAEAGVEMLREGGSSTDAAFATMLALTVVEPQSSGIGGGGFMLHHARRWGARDL